MSSILAAFLSGPLCVKAAPHDRTSYFIRCRTLNSEAHVSLFYYGCEHTRDWYGSLQGRFPHNGLFILLLCIYYNLCLAPCTFTVNKLLLLLLLAPHISYYRVINLLIIENKRLGTLLITIVKIRMIIIIMILMLMMMIMIVIYLPSTIIANYVSLMLCLCWV